jgi:hypothetical protein
MHVMFVTVQRRRAGYSKFNERSSVQGVEPARGPHQHGRALSANTMTNQPLSDFAKPRTACGARALAILAYAVTCAVLAPVHALPPPDAPGPGDADPPDQPGKPHSPAPAPPAPPAAPNPCPQDTPFIPGDGTDEIGLFEGTITHADQAPGHPLGNMSPECIAFLRAKATGSGKSISALFLSAERGDAVRMEISDGVAAGTTFIRLATGTAWGKTIEAWSAGSVSAEITQAGNTPQFTTGFLLRQPEVSAGGAIPAGTPAADTIVFTKPGTFGFPHDVSHWDKTFWPLFDGKIVDFTWLTD